jgi:hypothetical protein
MKIRVVGTELFMQTDIRTDKHDATNSSLSQFCEPSVKGNHEIIYVKINYEVFSRTLGTLA